MILISTKCSGIATICGGTGRYRYVPFGGRWPKVPFSFPGKYISAEGYYRPGRSMSNVSAGRLFTIILSLGCFAVFLGLYLYMDMKDGSPYIVNGEIAGYWVMNQSAMASFLLMAILFAVILVLALVWPYVAGPSRSGARPAEEQCPRCGVPIGRDYMVCPSCTIPLMQICPGCGERLPASYNACPRCGNVIRPHSP